MSMNDKLVLLANTIASHMQRICHWAKSTLQMKEPLKVEWLPLSNFDAHSQFALSFLDECMDVGIDRDQVNVTITNEDGGFRQVSFHLDTAWELFVKTEIRRRLKSHDAREYEALTPPIQNLGRVKEEAAD